QQEAGLGQQLIPGLPGEGPAPATGLRSWHFARRRVVVALKAQNHDHSTSDARDGGGRPAVAAHPSAGARREVSGSGRAFAPSTVDAPVSTMYISAQYSP